MIWFPFFPSDFIGATVGLSCQEVSIYNWMLTLYYELGPFPEDRVRTYRIVRCESDEQKRTVDFILSNYFVLVDGQWFNERAEAEKVKIAQNREIAQAKARKRWDAATHDAAALPQQSPSNAVVMPSTSTSTSITKPKEKTNTHTHSPSAPAGVDVTDWTDWIRIRKAKRLALSHAALKKVLVEGAKAKLTPAETIRVCCEQGWAGFKAEWYTKENLSTKSAAQQLEEMENGKN